MEVSRMIGSFIASGKRALAAILLHQVFEILQSDDFFEGDMNRLGARLGSQHADSLIRELSVQPNRCQCASHCSSPVYTHLAAYIYVCQSSWFDVGPR